jgi:iron complex outermembrane recepter protein
MQTALNRLSVAVCLGVLLSLLVLSSRPMVAQQSNGGAVQGAVVDQHGHAISAAVITVRSESTGTIRSVNADGEGHFAVTGLPAGSYTVEISAPGFATISRRGVNAEGTAALSISLNVASVSEEVTVQADDTTSIASQLSPVKALLDAGSSRTEITNNFIRNFSSPVTDFTDLMQIAPGTVSVSPNGIGLEQSNTSFRGFIDGDYSITYDQIPFEDTNNPTHHSWAFFPGQQVGSIDFDRSPGTASDIGPANYGGSIHLLSPNLYDRQQYKIAESYGSFNTNLVEGTYASGLFGGKNPKGNLWFEGRHLTSDGYETYDYDQQSAFELKYEYRFSDTTKFTLLSSVVIEDNNNSGNNPLRGQIIEFGNNYYEDGTKYLSDGATIDAQWYKMYFYHVPTDFEYAGLTKELGQGWKLDTKAYTYTYSNHEKFNNSSVNSTILDPAATQIYLTYYGLSGAPSDCTGSTPPSYCQYFQTISSKLNSGIDKYNGYNKLGDIATVSKVTKYGVFRFGSWYEWAGTNRFQIKSDPLNWVDLPGVSAIKFHEHFITNSVQPFAEFELTSIPKWTITAGIKSAYYNMYLKQYADNGHIVGGLGGAPYVTNDANYNSWLPSFEANYRVRDNWSLYGQFGMGSVIPPSSVFDVNQTPSSGASGVTVLPKPQVAYTTQFGSVLKLNHLSVDGDAYYIHFQNGYVATPVADSYTYNATPASNTLGMEGEGNLTVGHGLSIFFNGTLDSAKYVSTSTTPSLWVAGAPHDTETIGLTYQRRAWDFGFFDKRVGTQWNDNTDASGNLLHQAIPISSFSVSNLFLNYTIKSESMFSGSKLRLSINNIFSDENVEAVTAANTGTATTPFTPSLADQMTLLPGRSIMFTFQMGFVPKKKQ